MTGTLEEKEQAARHQHREGSGDIHSSMSPNSYTTTAMPTRLAPEHFPQIQMPNPQDRKISIAVDPVALITTECITVTSAMRKHARWAHSSVSAILGGGPLMASGKEIGRSPKQSSRNSGNMQNRSSQPSSLSNGTVGKDESLASRWGLRGKKGKSMQDNPLLAAFARLRIDLRGCKGRYQALPRLSQKTKNVQISEASTFLPCFIHSFK